MSLEKAIIDENELVQYFIINKDFDMSAGKVAVQVSHVAEDVALKEGSYNPTTESPEQYHKYSDWYNRGRKKILLTAPQKKLEDLVSKGFYFIRDNGLTEVPPNTLTCVSLGVMSRKDAQPHIKRFQLYSKKVE